MKKILLAIIVLSAEAAIAQTAATNTGTLYISGSSDVFYSGGDFTNNTGSALTNNGQLYIKGNLSNGQATMATGTGTLLLNGTSAQSVGGTQIFKTYNFNSNNANGITLNNDLSVSGTHTFTSGLINTSATNFLVYEAGSSYTGSGDTRHVNGWVKKIGATNFTFPVGNASYERNILLSNLTASSEFNVKYLGSTPYTNQVQLPIRNVNTYEYWSVSKVSGGSATVTMNWNRSKVYFPNWIMPDIRAAEYNGSMWTNQGGTATGDVTTTGSITSNSVSTFNLFTFGTISWILPVSLTDFDAKWKDNYTRVTWTTASEINVKQFIVERSDDGRSFYSVSQTLGRNSGQTEHYESRDSKAIQHVAYYRLKTVDNDGKESLSRVVSVSGQDESNLILITNPVTNTIKLLATTQLNGAFQYQLSAGNGQAVQRGNLSIQNGGQYEISLQGKPAAGMHILKISNGQQAFSFKLIIQ